MSGLGKGAVTASIAKLLSLCGYNVTCVKIDPYLNVDAGTMNPIMHGEVFVTEDGGETDMDLGTYERFLDKNLPKTHNITTGQVYSKVIEDERKGVYLGECVQIIPHITDEIKRRIRLAGEASHADVVVVECGGTVGDIEGLPFYESLRQMRMEEGRENTFFVHVTLAPLLPRGEQKTKPTQHSVQELRRIGIQPDMIVVRSKVKLSEQSKSKISLFTNVEKDAVVSSPDLESIYSLPLVMEEEGVLRIIGEKLNLKTDINWGDWPEIAKSFLEYDEVVKIALVGKYLTQADTYVSVHHALMHAGAKQGCKVDISWIDAERLESDPDYLETLSDYDGILIPGGFGKRGSEGKILAADYARVHGIPFLGICFGFQLSLVSFARHVCGLEDANSTEVEPNTGNPVVDLLPEQKEVAKLGATMRLGEHNIYLVEGTLAHRLYGSRVVRGRHRHRYEFNLDYRKVFEENGAVFSGFSERGLVEIFELPTHPYYIATQYHPEFRSRPGRPEPVYYGFIRASRERKAKRLSKASPLSKPS